MNRKQRRTKQSRVATKSTAASAVIQTMFADAVRHHNSGDLAQAELLYRQILTIDNRHADSLHLIGVIAHQMGRMDEAEANYRLALQVRPAIADASYHLGVLLQRQGRLFEAEAHYRQAIKYRQNHADAHNNLGIVLQNQGRSSDAEDSYRQALRAKPNFADACNNLGAVLKELGRIDEARGYMNKAINLAPDKPGYHFNLAGIKIFTADDPHLAQIEELAKNAEKLSTEEQVSLQFALGKAYEDVGVQARSFRHLLAGNALKRRLCGYDEAATLKLFERIQSVFTAELIGRKSPECAPGDGPIFVFGMPRSGTTLVEQVLASHSKVFGAGELDLFEQEALRLVGANIFPEAIADISVNDLHRLGLGYLASLRNTTQSILRATDKRLKNYLFCGLIHLALPSARIIHTCRDPIDTCLSCFSTLFSGSHPYAYDLSELGRYYSGYAALMEHWRQVLPEGIMLDVQYEDVVADLEGQTRRILSHCGLEWEDACLTFFKTERPVRTASAVQVRRPIYQSSVGRAESYLQFLQPLIDALELSTGELPGRQKECRGNAI